MKKRNRVLTGVLLLIFLLLFGLSAYKVWQTFSQYKTAKDSFSALREEAALPASSSDAADIVQGKTDRQMETDKPEESEIRRYDFATLKEKNADCAAWVSVPGTAIDYPVMHTPSEPERYLRKDFDGEYSIAGTPFLDGRCTLDSDDLLVYGHHMNDGSMFSALYGYTRQSYCEAHPTVEWETEKGIQIYTVYAVATVGDADAWYDFVDAADEADFQRRLDALKSSASYCTDAAPQYGDRLLTLSTCYGLTGDDRLIVIAVQTG